MKEKSWIYKLVHYSNVTIQAAVYLIVISAFILTYLVGIVHSFLIIFILIFPILSILSFLLNSLYLKKVCEKQYRDSKCFFVMTIIIKFLFWSGALYFSVFPIIEGQFSEKLNSQIHLIIYGAVLVNCVLECLKSIYSLGKLNLSLYLAGILFFIFELIKIHTNYGVPESVVIEPPFSGEWYVMQGGRSAFINHHYAHKNQSFALDLVKQDDLESKDEFEDFQSWNEQLYAPITGVVKKVENNIHDNKLGETNKKDLLGNYVLIKNSKGQYALIAHLKNGSIIVEEGENILAGSPIGTCGNSGNSSQPHIHLQVHSDLNFFGDDNQTFPMAFSETSIKRGDEKYAVGLTAKRGDLLIKQSP